jgi:hypothetical protein
MTEDFEQLTMDCGCTINIKKHGGAYISHSLCEKHRKQKKDAD